MMCSRRRRSWKGVRRPPSHMQIQHLGDSSRTDPSRRQIWSYVRLQKSTNSSLSAGASLKWIKLDCRHMTSFASWRLGINDRQAGTEYVGKELAPYDQLIFFRRCSLPCVSWASHKYSPTSGVQFPLLVYRHWSPASVPQGRTPW